MSLSLSRSPETRYISALFGKIFIIERHVPLFFAWDFFPLCPSNGYKIYHDFRLFSPPLFLKQSRYRPRMAQRVPGS